MSALSGHHVVILGASDGVGAALAEICLKDGATVSALGRSETRLQELAERLGQPRALRTHFVDGRDDAGVEGFLRGTELIDHLALCAGEGGLTGGFQDHGIEAARRSFDQKFWVQMSFACAALPVMSARSDIVFVTGAAALRAVRGTAWVAAVNGALHAMLGPLALDLAPVRVNAVCPGTMDTGHWRKLDPTARAAFFGRLERQLPVGRVGEAADAAQAIRYLMGASYVTGTVLPVDGGLTHSGAPDRSAIRK